MNEQNKASTSSIEDLEREEVWNILLELGVQERHFNELESRYRTLASTWLLATFAAVGFIATQEQVGLPIPRLGLMGSIAYLGAAGILLLWNLDLMVYHRLLDSCFLAGVLFENEVAWLPKLRTEMMRSAPKSGGVIRRIIYFYIGSIGVLVVLGSLLLILLAQEHIGARSWFLLIPLLFVVGIGSSCIRRESLKKSAGWSRVEELGLL